MGPKPTAGRGVGAGKNAAAVPPKGAASANTTKGGAGMSAKVEPATKATGASKPIPSYMRATKAANQETKPKFVYKVFRRFHLNTVFKGECATFCEKPGMLVHCHKGSKMTMDRGSK